MKAARSFTPASASTIDGFPVARTPALVGYWKCSEGSGTEIRDYSKYGHHLAVQLKPQDTLPGVWGNPGYFSPYFGTRAYINAVGTPLNTLSKVVVFSAEIKRLTAFDDLDAGTASDFAQVWSAETYTGFMLGGQLGDYYTRAVAGATYQGSNVTLSIGGTACLAGAFVPSSRLLQSDNIGKSLQTVVAPLVASLTAQDGKFSLQAGGSADRIAVRNYQMWVFDAEPAELEMTVQWMAASPGLVPPWWAGR